MVEGDKNHSGNMLANKNTLLRKEGQMHKKCINFVQVNAIVNTVEYIGLIMLLYWHIYNVSSIFKNMQRPIKDHSR